LQLLWDVPVDAGFLSNEAAIPGHTIKTPVVVFQGETWSRKQVMPKHNHITC